MLNFEQSICHYDDDEVIRRVLAIMGAPEPIPGAGNARKCVEVLLAAWPALETREIGKLMAILDARIFTPSSSDVRAETYAVASLVVGSKAPKRAVEVHAGVGAIFHYVDGDTLHSAVAPISGGGMDARRDYLDSCLAAGREKIARSFS